MSFFFELPLELRTPRIAAVLGLNLTSVVANATFPDQSRQVGPTVVCGSPFEVANDPSLGGSAASNSTFDAATVYLRSTPSRDLELQRRTVWIKAALEDTGQLRQRVAWALSQILVIVPDVVRSTESYDIMVSRRCVIGLIGSSRLPLTY